MTSKVVAVLVLSLSALLLGCGGGGSGVDTVQSPQPGTSPPPQTPPQTGNTVAEGPLSISGTAVSFGGACTGIYTIAGTATVDLGASPTLRVAGGTESIAQNCFQQVMPTQWFAVLTPTGTDTWSFDSTVTFTCPAPCNSGSIHVSGSVERTAAVGGVQTVYLTLSWVNSNQSPFRGEAAGRIALAINGSGAQSPSPATSMQLVVQVNPATTFKTTLHPGDVPRGGTSYIALPLSAAGQTLTLQSTGSWTYQVQPPNIVVGGIAAVFIDVTDTPLQAGGNPPPAATPTDCSSAGPDPYPNDFLVGETPVSVVVPQGAFALRLSVDDCFFGDNGTGPSPISLIATASTSAGISVGLSGGVPGTPPATPPTNPPTNPPTAEPAPVDMMDIAGNPVSAKSVYAGGGTAATLELAGVASVVMAPTITMTQSTATLSTDASNEMTQTAQALVADYDSQVLDNKVLLMRLSTPAESNSGVSTVRVTVSDVLAQALSGGALPQLLYYANSASADADNGEDNPELLAADRAVYDAATRQLTASLPAEAFSIGQSTMALFVAAGKNTAAAAQAVRQKKTTQNYDVHPSGVSVLDNPLGTGAWNIVGYFGEARTFNNGAGGNRGHAHAGLDIATGPNGGVSVPLYAAAPGRIERVTTKCIIAAQNTQTRYGVSCPNPNLVVQMSAGSVKVKYHHVAKGSLAAAATTRGDATCATALIGNIDALPPSPFGKTWPASGPKTTLCALAKSDKVAESGASGTFGVHLHLEVLDSIGKVNPLPYFSKIDVLNEDTGVAVPLNRTADSWTQANGLRYFAPTPLNVPLFALPKAGLTSRATAFPDGRLGDLPLRMSLTNSSGQEILARRKQDAAGTVREFIPGIAAWTPAQVGTQTPLALPSATPSNPAVMDTLDRLMLPPDSNNVQHTNGTVLVRPFSVGVADLNVALNYASGLPGSSGWPSDTWYGQSGFTGALATLAIPVNVQPVKVTLTFPDVVDIFTGTPASVELSDFFATSVNDFQFSGANSICSSTGGERGAPLFSNSVPFDATMYGARQVLNMPYQTSGPIINRLPCSSFIAFQRVSNNAPPPNTQYGYRVWVSASARGFRTSGTNALDWEYQIRYDSGDPFTRAGYQCTLGTVANSNAFGAQAASSSCIVTSGAATP